ncbi:unnamed protein product [Ceutorhynchus assimilis]|uniref:Bromo domain-containing protein n=1 Tax=Ceutorhynchus assimilis TaxID=467358 RepID=A0A9P0GP16_9CUCU|nr:unnamed protein product [Ceutorhynchus assimilis]
MFPTFISILDIQSWWEVPSIAHFCSLFRTAFNLLDFDIEDLEEALLTDGTEETSWLQELIVRLLSGCLPNNEISTFNYQMFLRRLFRQKCQEHDRFNPFNTDCDFTLLPLRTKVDILHALCDFRLDAEDVLDQLKNLEADSLRVEPLGYDNNESAYWYFYGTRLYREDFEKKNNKTNEVWQVICFTEDDWFQLTRKFKSSTAKNERALHSTLSKNFLPELPRLFKEKERQARRRLLENQPKRTSNRTRKSVETVESEAVDPKKQLEETKAKQEEEELQRKKNQDIRRRESYERRSKSKLSEEPEKKEENTSEPPPRHEMASKKRNKGRQRKVSSESEESNKEIISAPKRKKTKNDEPTVTAPAKPVGRQTNNSLSALDGQIVIQQPAPPVASKKKKLKTSQVFQQTDEDLLVGMHKILDFVKNHEDSWPFLDPVEEEYAPNYYTIIRRPMDLTKMEDRLDQGYYKTYEKFKGDFQLIVNNCRLYNGTENEYTEMVDNLVQVFERATQKYLDQISSSDEEIAVENLNSEDEVIKSLKKRSKRSESPVVAPKTRKPALAAQGRKRERLSEEASSEEEEDDEPISKKSKKEVKQSSDKKTEKKNLKEIKKKKPEKESKKPEKESKKPEKESNKKPEKESRKPEKESRKPEKESKKSEKESKKPEKESKKPEKESKKPEKVPKKLEKEKEVRTNKKIEEEKESTKKQLSTSKAKKAENLKEEKRKPKKRGRKKKKLSPVRSESLDSSRCPSLSPPRSILSTPPPSDVDEREEKNLNTRDQSKPIEPNNKNSIFPWDTPLDEPPPCSPPATEKRTMEDLPPYSPMGFKPAKDKHNKLRETIEKLKAKSSEISRMQKPLYEFEGPDDHLKENKDKNKKVINNEPHKHAQKDNKLLHQVHKTKKNHQQDVVSEDTRKHMSKKKEFRDSECSALSATTPKPAQKQSNFEALSLATEQTLKDINKWLDDTPKFADFSSASNSPSNYLALDDFDLQLPTPRPSLPTPSSTDPKKMSDKPTGVPSPVQAAKKDGNNATLPTSGSTTTKDGNKKKSSSFRDPSKFFSKRREVQRTIDRLQPGKGKGNLITNVQSATKTDETFPLNPLLKLKDTKNSLIVKTDTNAPKLSLGSVLDSFGKHKFAVDDQKKEEIVDAKESTPTEDLKKEEEKDKSEEVQKEEKIEDKEKVEKGEAKIEQETKETKITEDELNNSAGGPTPNLSAWFKAFGAPKAPAPQKKPDKTDAKEEEATGAKSERVPPGDPSPVLENPQPIARQRRISTGSSMSERSSFSQDLDSPRVGMEERGAYPAPYPSPLHRSPSSGASPVTASPRPDISPRSQAYPPFNGGPIRVGFYQDTVASSNKSSPDKSCSPRETHPPNSPYNNNYNQPITAPEHHVYAPNTTPGGYSASYTANSPYYTHTMPSYSSTNPTPPYNLDGSSSAYYDTSKIAEQYQAKPSQNYTANSPSASISSQASPIPQPQLSPHSPVIVHHSQSSPSVHSPSMHSPSLHSVHSSQHSSQHSHSPQQSLHSPGMSVVSPHPQVNSPSSGVTQHSPSMTAVNSPMTPAETFHPQQLPPQQDETSQHSNGSRVPESVLPMEIKEQQPVFPVKKRAFMDTDLTSQFEEIIVNRTMQPLNHQQDTNREQLLQKQQQDQLMQKHHQQQILQQQQKAQQLLQEQQKQQLLQEQKKIQEQQKQQQQLLQQQQQQQKNLQLLQQQAMAAAFSKAADQSLRTPSPPVQQQQQQQRTQQQAESSNLRSTNMASYQAATSAQYAANFGNGREGYPPLNVPSAHQPKLDMSKFTNMGYSGPEVNFTRALQQQYSSRSDLSSYARTTVQSAISQASQLLNSQSSLMTSQPAASTTNSLPGYQKTAATPATNQQTHSAAYQSGTSSNRTSVDSVAERLAAQAQQEATAAAVAAAAGYKQDSRSSYNSAALDLEQALGLSRNLSNMVDRYSNEQRMMAGLQSATNPYYSDKGLSTSAHMFNKQLFSQSNMAAAYGQQQQQQQHSSHAMQQQQQQASAAQAQSLYSRQMAAASELQQHDIKSAAAATSQDRKQRKKKSSSAAKGFKTNTLNKSKFTASSETNTSHSTTASAATSQSVPNQGQAHQQQPQHAFQSYAGLKSTNQGSIPSSGTSAALDALKNTSGVPGSAFNFGSGPLGMPPDSYPNLLEDFRGTSNYFMGGANGKPGQSTAQSYHPPPFLNPAAAHQGRGAAYPPLGGPFMDSAGTQLYQHYLQAGVLNQGLLGAAAAAAGGYAPPSYHAAAALAMRQPYDSMSRPSWL